MRQMKNSTFTYAQVRFADIQLLRYRVPAFQDLSLGQKQYVYHLAEAALCGRDILWDQNCRHNLAIRRLLEDILQPSAIVQQKVVLTKALHIGETIGRTFVRRPLKSHILPKTIRSGKPRKGAASLSIA